MKRKNIDIKQRARDIRDVTEYHLTEDQVKDLIREKIQRAKLYHDAWKKREVVLESDR